MSRPEPNAPMTDEQIIAATVGERQIHGRPVHLAEYDPTWPEIFARQRERISTALGGTALRIEHVGSTSVPGLAAKPVVDILVVVADSGNEDSYLPMMEVAGYELRVREPAFHEHRMFVDHDPTVQVHVLSDGNEEIERYLLFRDRLRNDEADRALYERTKRELARKRWKYVQNYADTKGSVVEEIIARARQTG